MEYSSVHKFRLDQVWDAQMFIEDLLDKGFSYCGYDKNGGVGYGKGKEKILIRCE